ncbi:MAG: DUF4197 domain-containing protein [Pseudomonadota bacterium]
MRVLIYLTLLFSLTACSEKDLRKTIEIINASVEEVPLTREEVSAALKDSLSKGISKASIVAGANNGYLGNPELKIQFPEDARKVEDALRKIGLGSEVDRFVQQLNRGAEAAAVKAKPIFIKAITSLTIQDAFGILNGSQDAATQYLIRTTGDELYSQFLPVVGNTLDEVKATRYYDDIVERYNEIPGVRKVNPDLDDYATEKAIDGLFLLVAKEEANIRANPRARTTQLLKRVFGSLD